MITSVKDRVEARRMGEDADRGDLVQTVLLIAGFAIVAILVVVWLGTAILNKGADAASCIEGSSTYSGDFDEAETACTDTHAANNSFTDDAGYSSRYPTP